MQCGEDRKSLPNVNALIIAPPPCCTGFLSSQMTQQTIFLLTTSCCISKEDLTWQKPRETYDLIGSDKVEGTNVYGADGNKIGSIERVMIGKRSGKVDYAVLSFGGFLGLGDEHYPLPWEYIKYNTELGGYQTHVTEQQLKGAPKYANDDDWDWGRPDPRPQGVGLLWSGQGVLTCANSPNPALIAPGFAGGIEAAMRPSISGGPGSARWRNGSRQRPQTPTFLEDMALSLVRSKYELSRAFPVRDVYSLGGGEMDLPGSRCLPRVSRPNQR